MKTYAITGSATGIGAEVKKMIAECGDKIITVDIKDADIIADLSTPEGREIAIEAIHKEAPDGLDGFIPCAGLGPQVPDTALVISVNYFGAKVLTEGLKDLLVKKKGTVVMVVSNSASFPGLNPDLIKFMLEDNDEEAACKLVKTIDGATAYAASKQALTRWMRRQTPGWAGEGVRMNAIAPGATMTPLLQEGLEHPVFGEGIRSFTVPTGDFGTPEQIASVILFLLSEQASFCCGSVFFVDGGTDALLRPDEF